MHATDWQAIALGERGVLLYLAGLLRQADHARWAAVAEEAAASCPLPAPTPVGPWGAGLEVK